MTESLKGKQEKLALINEKAEFEFLAKFQKQEKSLATHLYPITMHCAKTPKAREIFAKEKEFFESKM